MLGGGGGGVEDKGLWKRAKWLEEGYLIISWTQLPAPVKPHFGLLKTFDVSAAHKLACEGRLLWVGNSIPHSMASQGFPFTFLWILKS